MPPALRGRTAGKQGSSPRAGHRTKHRLRRIHRQPVASPLPSTCIPSRAETKAGRVGYIGPTARRSVPARVLGREVLARKIIPRLVERIEFIETEIAKLEIEREVAEGARKRSLERVIATGKQALRRLKRHVLH